MLKTVQSSWLLSFSFRTKSKSFPFSLKSKGTKRHIYSISGENLSPKSKKNLVVDQKVPTGTFQILT